MSKKVKISFDEYFEEIYKERWPQLRDALVNKHNQVVRPTFNTQSNKNIVNALNLPSYENSESGVQHKINNLGNKVNYIMDPASIICAQALEINEADSILDMCAAPGGKTLILLEMLQSGELWSNEISRARREKLKRVIQQYVPKHIRNNIFIKGKDGNQYGIQYPDTFDKVLLDAPCSGESHLLKTPKELAKWNIKRTKRLSQNQYSLLCSALLTCKPAGSILYSTCSISPLENDGVIEKILTKKGETVELDLPELSKMDLNIERTKFGHILLPDRINAGPIFFSRLKKKTLKEL